jgi:hypothetical protein
MKKMMRRMRGIRRIPKVDSRQRRKRITLLHQHAAVGLAHSTLHILTTPLVLDGV